jgi:hypothetical protein
MKFDKLFQDFCNEHKYIGKIDFNKSTKEYSIIINKDTENAGAFLSKEELANMSNEQIEKLLSFLHEGFVLKFNK